MRVYVTLPVGGMEKYKKALILTILSWLTVNAPLGFMLYKYDLETAELAFLYAPNQFLFLLIFFPAATFLICSASSSIANLFEGKSRVIVIIASWIFSLSLGATIATLDISGDEPLDIYQLSPNVAEKTVQSMKLITNVLLEKRNNNSDNWPWSEADELSDNANTVITTKNIDFKTIKDKNIDSVPTASQYLYFVGSRIQQDNNELIDSTLETVNILELFIAMFTLMHLVFWVFVAFVGKVAFSWNESVIKSSAISLAIAVAFLMLFSIFSAFNFQIRGIFFGGVEDSTRGDILGAIGTLVLGSILTVVFLRDDWLDTAKFAYPAILNLVALVFVTTWFSSAFSIIGNINNGVIIVVLLLASILVVSTSLLLATLSPRKANNN